MILDALVRLKGFSFGVKSGLISPDEHLVKSSLQRFATYFADHMMAPKTELIIF